MKSLKLLIAGLMLLLAFGALAPKVQAEDILHTACSSGGANGPAADSSICQQKDNQNNSNNANPVSGPKGIIKEATNIFAIVAIVAGLVMIVYGGFVFTTAGGARAGDNATRAREARTIIVSALTGIVVVALAWTIVTYINTQIIH